MPKPTILVTREVFFTIGNYEEIKDIDNAFSGIELQNCIIRKAEPADLTYNHPTEQRFPEQCKLFRDTIEEMYLVMLKKNLDYSPYNIKVTGMRGLVTRLWDKSARFFSLMGLDIGTGEWNEQREPENESIDQNLIDWANYCIIARIFMAGKWAK